MKNNRFIPFVILRYPGRLSVVFLFNLLSVLLSIFVFLMIEPFTKLLFRGNLDNLSPISAAFIKLLSQLVDFASLSSSVITLLIAVLVLFLFKNTFYYASQWVMASVRSDLLYYLRNRIYDKFLRLPLSYFNSQKRGDVVSRAVNDTLEVQHTILNALKSFMTEPVIVLIYIVTLFSIHIQLSFYALVLLPATFLLIAWISSKLRSHSRTSKQRMGSLLAHVEETLGGLKIIKGFNGEEHAEKVFHKLNDQFTHIMTKVYRLVDLSSPLSEFLGVTVVMIVLVIGGAMVLDPQSALTAELFITYIALFSQVISPIKNISTAYSNYKRGQAALDRINDILDADEVIVSPTEPITKNSFDTELKLNCVSFAYEQEEVLHEVTLSVPKGKTVALVGQSGSGKTTIADLMERFYDPTQGEVLLDGIDARNFNLQAYHSFFALVSQDVVLFNDTLFNNLTIGMQNVSEEEVIEALKVANIYEFVQTLEQGVHHPLGDRGLNLSGGQRQRVSIARAILRKAPILILDEATSAMDTESERLVEEALNRVMKNRTVVVIAHRLSTVQHADCIYVLDKGRVVEQGKHDELLAKDGIYSKLFKIQQYN